MSRSLLGIDPGDVSGGAALLVGPTRIAAWWSWLRLDRVDGSIYRVTAWTGEEREVANQVQIGAFVWDTFPRGYWPPMLSVEGLYADPQNPQSVVALSFGAGQLCGAMGLDPVHRPLAMQWRPRQLGIAGNTPKAKAEAVAVKLAEAGFTWPSTVRPSTKKERGAVAESAWIARDGWVMAGERAA